MRLPPESARGSRQPRRAWSSLIGVWWLLLALAAGGCQNDEPTPVAPTAIPTPTAPVATPTPAAPVVPIRAGDLAALVDGHSAFAFDLYRILESESGNLLFSPYSISLALAMVYAGARGETERQMAETLQYRLSQDRLHAASNHLQLELGGRGQVVEGGSLQLHIANALWGQMDHEFLASFLDRLTESYGTEVKPMDFHAQPQKSRIAINAWIAEQTENQIRDLIPPGVIDPTTRLVLTNAIYFDATWHYPFAPSATRPLPFLDKGIS